ncbi:gephyrin-like molybdotransferase Glp [Halomonas huangheensis]|uniref:Molybdopterin molybdenumtransferase n=1 Tax=Halomonas huangheensis TaxID=1178482 RepID=W1N1D4_9GAMM|nr:gephyrin-like molybdotransferase Glp [Halomonas huangheensis]ALM52359.1 molybdopterin molybdochelatase [Halomonas huangheensis]ERL49293.1 hypothetical protein BJB45_07420 [Halomonas huangheensis]
MSLALSCFEPGDHMLSVEQARQAVLGLIKAPLASERVALAEAHGRVLSEPVFASFDVPGHTNAAMDGIALAWPQVAEADQHGDAEVASRGRQWLRVGEALAGRPFAGVIGAGECVVITTGAPLPTGTDTVIMQEQVEAQGDLFSICDPQLVRTGQNVRQAGEDIACGATALAAGTRLDAAALGMLASLGFAEVAVRRRARVAVFSTGDEVTAPGERRGAAAIYDANRFSLMGLLREQGAEVMDLGIIVDDRQALIVGLRRAASMADLVVSSGGVSTGQADHTRAALEQLGRLAVWRIALRPGRPMACGLLTEREVPFLGLPGNPVACMVTALCFMIPMLRVMQGRESITESWQGIAESHFESRAGRTDFCRGVYRVDQQGNLRVVNTGEQGSGILSSMVAANCLVELSEQSSGAGPGDMVAIHPLSKFV